MLDGLFLAKGPKASIEDHVIHRTSFPRIILDTYNPDFPRRAAAAIHVRNNPFYGKDFLEMPYRMGLFSLQWRPQTQT
jgi:hypothetical protein